MSILLTVFPDAVAALAAYADPVPDKDDVKAGWGACGIFVVMAVAVALLGWSLVRQLRKTERNAEAGVFGDEDKPDIADDDRTTP
jgi:hypothetical protein